MPDPVMVGGIRAQVVMQGVSGDPEDRFVNTFAFGTSPPGAVTTGHLNDVHTALDDFYNTPDDVGNALRSYLGCQLNGDNVINMYDLGETPPRTVHVFDFDWTPTTAPSMPSEVACCLSFYATRSLPSQRGRIFFGPLKTTTLDVIDSVPRPTEAVRHCLAFAANRLASLTSTVRWGVLSRADGVIRQVTAGWVDDSWDIQRRRGEDPTGRVLFP